MERRISVEPFHPGEYIKDGMEAKGWTQDDLAEVLGRTRQHVNRLIQGRTAVTPDTAHELSKAFGTTAELWMNLQTSYELALAAKDQRDIERRAVIYAKVPVREIKKRGWIPETASIRDLETEVCRFLRIESTDQEPCIQVAARMSTSYGEPANPAQIAWMFRARQLAEMVHAAPFDKDVFAKSISDLRSLAANPEDARRVPRILADMGVRLVLIEHLPKSKIDGVAFRVNNAPAIALSLRFDRLDNFWFTLMHELIHIKYNDATLLDVDIDRPGSEVPDEEKRANREAADALIPSDKLDSFIRRAHPLYYHKKVTEFAHARGVHPSIVAGQLQHRNPRLYGRFAKLRAGVREHIIGQALTDGWGNCPPVDHSV